MCPCDYNSHLANPKSPSYFLFFPCFVVFVKF